MLIAIRKKKSHPSYSFATIDPVPMVLSDIDVFWGVVQKTYRFAYASDPGYSNLTRPYRSMANITNVQTPRILIVSAEASKLVEFSTLLTKKYNGVVDVAENQNDAVKMWTTNTYDLVYMDENLTTSKERDSRYMLLGSYLRRFFKSKENKNTLFINTDHNGENPLGYDAYMTSKTDEELDKSAKHILYMRKINMSCEKDSPFYDDTLAPIELFKLSDFEQIQCLHAFVTHLIITVMTKHKDVGENKTKLFHLCQDLCRLQLVLWLVDQIKPGGRHSELNVHKVLLYLKKDALENENSKKYPTSASYVGRFNSMDDGSQPLSLVDATMTSQLEKTFTKHNKKIEEETHVQNLKTFFQNDIYFQLNLDDFSTWYQQLNRIYQQDVPKDAIKRFISHFIKNCSKYTLTDTNMDTWFEDVKGATKIDASFFQTSIAKNHIVESNNTWYFKKSGKEPDSKPDSIGWLGEGWGECDAFLGDIFISLTSLTDNLKLLDVDVKPLYLFIAFLKSRVDSNPSVFKQEMLLKDLHNSTEKKDVPKWLSTEKKDIPKWLKDLKENNKEKRRIVKPQRDEKAIPQWQQDLKTKEHDKEKLQMMKPGEAIIYEKTDDTTKTIIIRKETDTLYSFKTLQVMNDAQGDEDLVLTHIGEPLTLKRLCRFGTGVHL